MVRNVLGTILAIIGAGAAVSSPYEAWYDGRHGSTYRFSEIFHHVTAAESSTYQSMMLPLAAGALVTLIGLLLRSRLLVGLSGLIVLGFTVLWMVQQGRAAGQLVISTKGTGLGQGVANSLGGGVLLLIAAVVMSGRTRVVYRTQPQPQPPVYAPSEYQQQYATPQQSYEASAYTPSNYQQQSYEPAPPYEQTPYQQPTDEQPSYEPPPATPVEPPAEPAKPTTAPPER